MSSSDDSVDSEDESGEPSVKRRRTLNPLNADAALAMVKNACDNIKLGSRLEFFGPALVMLADALHESSQRNAGSARFQRAASNPTWVCTSRDGTMIYSISEDDKLNAGSTLLVQFVPGISMESTTAVRLPVSEHLRTQQVAWIRVTLS